MQLPFTHEQFLDVFAAYHRLLWPAALALWLSTIVALLALWRQGPSASRVVAGVLAIHWIWSAIAYHLMFFKAINPAAVLFAGLFTVQAFLLVWLGVVRRRLVFTPSATAWGFASLILVVYAIVYPGLGLLSGLSYPRMPTFGVPCPTTILTLGLLLLVGRSDAWPVAVVPSIWAVVGGSAAFLLAIPADLMLPLAGAVFVFHIVGVGAQLKAPGTPAVKGNAR